jgi:hypothetical protein
LTKLNPVAPRFPKPSNPIVTVNFVSVSVKVGYAESKECLIQFIAFRTHDSYQDGCQERSTDAREDAGSRLPAPIRKAKTSSTIPLAKTIVREFRLK